MPDSLSSCHRRPTWRAHENIAFRAADWPASRASARALNFSHTRGTPKNTVGRTSRRLSGSFSKLSAK